MNTYPFKNKERGFSMIEVLISVVVLGFGLLALAAIQTTIIRASSETKAQSVALQLAKDKIEDLRSFQTLAGYQAITSGTDCNVATNDTTNCIIGGVDYTRSTTITRFAYKPSTSSFVSVTPLTGATPTGGSPAIYTEDNEYKRVLVSVTWADANGVTQTVGLEDGLGAISPGDSSKVTLNNSSSSQARKPKVFIYNPGDIAGVIPIAIGNGVSTAASNPTPVVKGNSNTVSETLFEILTYAGSSGNVTAQSRVETAVVKCSCSTANAPTGLGYRPTYWNGYRYAPPSLTTDAPVAGWAASGNNTVESDRCISCCRDHRDPVGIAAPKFDPWRATHNHYAVNTSTGALTLRNTGAYDESCRLIRVDGFFRVASDLRNDHLSLLEVNNNGDITNTDQNLRAYAPRVEKVSGVPTSNDSKNNYQNFVLQYMDDRFSNNGAFTYNTALATSGYESTFHLNNPVDNANTPVPISIKSTPNEGTTDSKWSHARGLYIDWIDAEALDVIKQKYTDCVDKTSQLERNTCVLPFVPFTSVNLTELANWKPKATATDAAAVDETHIRVANNSFYDPANTSKPQRGNVFKGTNPVVNNTAYAMPYITESNAGVALQIYAIDTDEAFLKDSQQYLVSNSVPPTPGSITFTVNLTGQSAGTPYPTVADNIQGNSCSTGGTPNPYSCGAAPDANGDMQIKISGYTKASTLSVPNGCRTSGNIGMTIINDYNVSSATNSTTSVAGTVGTPTNNANVLDTTVIYFNSVVASNALSIVFSGPTRYCPNNYNPSVVNKAANNSPDPTGYACAGNGNNKDPTWSATYVACPAGTP